MVRITANESMQAAFGPLNQEAEICDNSGHVIGYFVPRKERERRLLAAAKKNIDPKELERRKQYAGPGFTTKEVLDHLRSLEQT